MHVLGIDFTSRPSGRKPITCLRCVLDVNVLHPRRFEAWTDWKELEAALEGPGPWIVEIDFPFGQARRFIETIGWPLSWAGYIQCAAKLGRTGFRGALTRYREARPAGDKEPRRATDENWLARRIGELFLRGTSGGDRC